MIKVYYCFKPFEDTSQVCYHTVDLLIFFYDGIRIRNQKFLEQEEGEIKIYEYPKTPNITNEQKQELEEGIKYVARNYGLFLKHYNNDGNNGAGFDDEDLINALKEKGEYKRYK